MVFRGVFTIPSTPFTEDGALDQEGLRRVVEFCIRCGAHGLVYPVNASEFTVLSDEERLLASQLVVQQAAGRVPVVLGVAGVCTEHAIFFARHACEIGADAVIAMPPYIRKLTTMEQLVSYYQGISNAVNCPIFVQNHAVGTEMSVSILAALVRRVEHVEYIKEETMPATHKLSQIVAMDLPKLKGVFGGAGGRYLLLEHPRGTAGQMPGCHVTDVIVQLWDALEGGDRARAKYIYGLLAPLWAIEVQCPGGIYKEVLRRRGVIRCARARNARSDILDEHDHRALDEILADLEPLMTWHGEGLA